MVRTNPFHKFELVRVMKAVKRDRALPDEIPLRDGSVKIGSVDRGNTVRLEHPCLSGIVSRSHATFARGANGAWHVTDTNSTNGTFVNGERLSPFTKRSMRQGDCVTFGDRFILKEGSGGEEGSEKPPRYFQNCYSYVYQRKMKDGHRTTSFRNGFKCKGQFL